MIEAKAVLCTNFKEELINLQVEEVLLQEMQIEVQYLSHHSIENNRNKRIEQLKSARELLLTHNLSQMLDTDCLEDSIAEIEKAKIKIKRKGTL